MSEKTEWYQGYCQLCLSDDVQVKKADRIDRAGPAEMCHYCYETRIGNVLMNAHHGAIHEPVRCLAQGLNLLEKRLKAQAK